jgi:ABC-type multidrug transport system ATPase subunit
LHRAGECFGLLGPNGAGKTTTLSMLVSDVAPTAGFARLYGTDLGAARRAALDLMGYCPQSDALFDNLTGAEVLTYYAALNGVPTEALQVRVLETYDESKNVFVRLQPLVEAALVAMDLKTYAGTLTKHFSGGNKRRLSLALAYIGAPLVVYLDEPSTGALELHL